MNDNELDDFFRDRAKQPDILYQPEDWEKLKGLLERTSPGAENGPARINNGWRWGLLTLVIITGAGLGWNYFKSGEENQGAGSGLSDTQVEQAVSMKHQSEQLVSDSPKVSDAVVIAPGLLHLNTTKGAGSISNQVIQVEGVEANQRDYLSDETGHLRELRSLALRK